MIMLSICTRYVKLFAIDIVTLDSSHILIMNLCRFLILIQMQCPNWLQKMLVKNSYMILATIVHFRLDGCSTSIVIPYIIMWHVVSIASVKCLIELYKLTNLCMYLTVKFFLKYVYCIVMVVWAFATFVLSGV